MCEPCGQYCEYTGALKLQARLRVQILFAASIPMFLLFSEGELGGKKPKTKTKQPLDKYRGKDISDVTTDLPNIALTPVMRNTWTRDRS